MTSLFAWSPAAGATTYYRYWSYWHRAHGSTAWSYSNVGPNGYYPARGSMDGWRFGVGTASPHDPAPRFPGPDPCDSQQVGLVVDFGDSRVEVSCVAASTNTTGATVLGSKHTVRENNTGLVCGIDGDPPPPHCGDVVGKRRTAAPHRAAPRKQRPWPASAATRSTPPTPLPAATATRQPGRQHRHHPAPKPSGTSTPLNASPVAAAPSPTFVTAAPSSAGSNGGVPIGLLIGIPLAVVIAGAAVWRARRP